MLRKKPRNRHDNRSLSQPEVTLQNIFVLHYDAGSPDSIQVSARERLAAVTLRFKCFTTASDNLLSLTQITTATFYKEAVSTQTLRIGMKALELAAGGHDEQS